jgi:tetratricopeptide (TPR) repeat protein
MFFRKLFNKDYRYYLEKGDKLFAHDHFAEARGYYGDALEKLCDSAERAEEEKYLRARIAQAGDALALLNIHEADSALRSGDREKALEYLGLALELAEDGQVREKAENLMKESTGQPNQESGHVGHHGNHNCASCTTAHHAQPDKANDDAGQLEFEEQFHLLVQPLPGDLPQRYAELGKKFAYAYLLAHDDKDDDALQGYEELLTADKNDILYYETALIHYRRGNRAECERRLQQALVLNSDNPLCHLSMVHLCIDMGRLDEAVSWLQVMREKNLLAEQALILLGDVYQMQGSEAKAVDIFAEALQIPALKKNAAERLVPILSAQGRTEEANFLVKNYLKGCC